jgi:hypothetical protein
MPLELSASTTLKVGAVLWPGDLAGVARLTDGIGGAVVSSLYVAVPATPALPAASFAVTDRM